MINLRNVDVFDMNSLGAIYDNSRMPAAVVDNDGKIVYSNSAYTSVFGNDILYNERKAPEDSYEKLIPYGGKMYRMYVTPCGSLILLTFSESGKDMEQLFAVLGAAVKHTAASAFNALDEIYALVRDRMCDDLLDNQRIRNYLNCVDSYIMTLLSELVIPEQIVDLRNESAEYECISVSEEMKIFVEKMSEIFLRQPVAINSKISAGLTAVIDMRPVCVLLTDFITSCMEGNVFIDALSVCLFQKTDDFMEVKVTCSIISGKKQYLESLAVVKPEGYDPREELKRLLAERFGCRFSYKSSDTFKSISVEIPYVEIKMDMDDLRVNTSMVPYIPSVRFTDENILLSRFRINPKYDL